MSDEPKKPTLLQRILNIPLEERGVAALERIADALERAYPPVDILRSQVPPTEETLIAPSDEDLWQTEQSEIQRETAPPPAEEMPLDPENQN
jgi:hypothetical protein